MNKTLERRLLRLISGLLFALFVLAALVYWAGFRSTYYEQVVQSNHGLVEQIGLSFETLLKQISNETFRIPLYDRELLALVRQPATDPLFPLQVVRKLDSFNIGNDYIFSSYLYVKKTDLVFSTETNSVRTLAESPDRDQIVASRQGVISITSPRVVMTQSGRRLLLSIICPIPLYSVSYEGLLVVNVDAQTLYLDILKKAKIGPNMQFQVSDSQGMIVFRRDDNTLLDVIGTKTLSVNRATSGWLARLTALEDTVSSSYHSKTLDWTFSLETTVRSSSILLERLYLVLVTLIGLLVVGLLVLVVIVRRSTRPLTSAYSRTVWADFLSGVTKDLAGEAERRLRRDLDVVPLPHALFQVILVHHEPQDGVPGFVAGLQAELERARSWVAFHSVMINSRQTVIVLNEDPVSGGTSAGSAGELVRTVLGRLSPADQTGLFLSLSSPVDRFVSLPAAYRECAQAMDYRLTATSPIVELPPQGSLPAKPFFYPQDLEVQLLNNLLAGLADNCCRLTDQFFDLLTLSSPPLGDVEIRAHCFRLQAAISAKMSLYPLQNPSDLATAVVQTQTLGELRRQFSLTLQNASTEISQRLRLKDSSQIQAVCEFIDGRFTDVNFNLNSAADELGMNRNSLARLVKQHYGEGFNELTTHLRLRRARVLLSDTNLSVEQIAHGLGYSYANYFIRLFKSAEGLTPGQFRDRLPRPPVIGAE